MVFCGPSNRRGAAKRPFSEAVAEDSSGVLAYHDDKIAQEIDNTLLGMPLRGGLEF